MFSTLSSRLDPNGNLEGYQVDGKDGGLPAITALLRPLRSELEGAPPHHPASQMEHGRVGGDRGTARRQGGNLGRLQAWAAWSPWGGWGGQLLRGLMGPSVPHPLRSTHRLPAGAGG